MPNDLPVTCPFCQCPKFIPMYEIVCKGMVKFECGSLKWQKDKPVQSDRCRITTLTRELAEAKGKLAAAITPTDDLRQDEPLAYLVYLHDTTVHEYKLFPHKLDAIDCANEQMVESDEDWPIYPLYAVKGEYVRG